MCSQAYQVAVCAIAVLWMTFTSLTAIIHAQVPVVGSALVTVIANNIGPAGTCTGLFVTVTLPITAVLLVCSHFHTRTA